jgi:sirohydrochlorin cobaltochelatase
VIAIFSARTGESIRSTSIDLFDLVFLPARSMAIPLQPAIPVSAHEATPLAPRVVLLVGHGSREESANKEFEALVDGYRALHPEIETAHCYVELARPFLADALDSWAQRMQEVIVVPIFLFAAGHAKNDIPLAISQARSKYPHVRFRAARALGVHPNLVEIANARIQAIEPGDSDPATTAVVVVGRGASDPDANGDFCKLVRLLSEGSKFGWVVPSFIGVTKPLFKDAIELAARYRPNRILVVPYFLFGGRLLRQLESQVQDFSQRYPWIKTEIGQPLGVHEKLLSLVNERVEEAVAERAVLPCDTCQYRVPIAGVTEQVGGLKSLLWSMRHMLTHSMAMPHTHAHAPLRKHVLVCTNIDCAARGSITLLSALRRLLKKAGRTRDIRVTRTMCMGRCGEGPAVAVYPDGVWYRGVQAADASELVHEHLLSDRLVARLVDNIM